ncbi:hypothetical protein CLOACE_19010 [Clostridium acetireducens DSM 10703]|jgi:hypothetical protein|uniref:Uncharacterized protein n=1 Tax=Clostridium acetireducens DSM 10703 TaxID=1121290 RepID=A0A1E8EWU3_9CLOT|nr:hypothetical protein [Clostridium acetireducens]OFI05082.1 hypothetical protein CLOACE_19010 [Clostridium acetireducens DSM 10703]
MNFYIYICTIFFIIAILFDSLYISFYTPTKIKRLSLFSIIAFMFRYICLFILFFSENIKNLYLLKPILFLNLICLPIFFLISFYIFIRNNKIKFINILKVSFVIAVIYTIFILKSNGTVNWNLHYGYTINLLNQIYVDVTKIIINLVFIILSLNFILKNGVNKKGLFLILISSAFTIIAIILDITAIGILPHIILSELMWSITFNYSLNQVIQKNK